jgi:RND family efflux transporter MFP subunit
LNAAVDGWIRETLGNSTGSLVKKGEPLAAFYSPEFLGAEQAYLYSLGALDRFQDSAKETPEQIKVTYANIQQCVDSLRNLGMADIQIEEIKRTRQLTQQIKIFAPEASFILARNISAGQRFEKGYELYRLADLSHVWLMADLFENEARLIKPGQSATVSYQERTWRARMGDVLPQFDPATRTLKVRFELDNPGYALRPDMFVDVEFEVNLPPAVTAPIDAVLDSGLKKTVFVDRGNGYFEPRAVETGWRMGDRIQITRGLEPGERIVVSGNFLLDSETRMKSIAAAAQKDPVCGMDVDPNLLGKTQYKGKTYYFCSAACKQKFDKTPEQHLGKQQLVQRHD